MRQYQYDTFHLLDSVGLILTSGITGVRYARNCHPDDLWISYFTSSRHAKKFREEHGEPDVIEIRQTFNDSLQAREWEYKVLRRLGVIKDDRWLNKGLGKALPPMIGSDNPMSGLGQNHPLIGRKQSIETSKKKSEKMIGKNTAPQTTDVIKNRVAKNTGQKRTIEQRKNLSNGMKGIPKTEEHKKKLSEIRKGMIRCYDLQEHKNVTISKNIYYSISDRYCHHNSKRCKEDKGVS